MQPDLRRLSSCWFSGLCVLLTTTGAAAADQFPHWFPKVDGVARTAVTYAKCQDCHRQPPATPVEPTARPTIRYAALVGIQKSNWVTKTEETIWLDHDKHVQAYAVLGNPQSQHMATVLGIEDATRDRRCLACHSSKPVWEPNVEVEAQSPFLLTKAEMDRFNFVVGVDCEGCHGPSQKPEGSMIPDWLLDHTTSPDIKINTVEQGAKYWRFYSPAEKLKHGYVDVRSPYIQTQMCLSCHMGDATMGRIVTHDMFAAGHPPLPAFEVATFRSQMPPHWQPLSEKSPEVREQFLKLSADPFNPGAVPDTRLMLVGALASVRQYLILLSDVSQPPESFPGPNPALRPSGPELSLYDCTACHHDLSVKSWRQTRPLKTPGRPVPRAWSFDMAVLALELFGEGSEGLKQELTALRDEFYAHPFGRGTALEKVASSTVPKLDQWALDLEKRTWTPADSMRILRHISELAQRELLEYETARDYFWLSEIAFKESGMDLPEAQKALESMSHEFLAVLHSSRVSTSGEGLDEGIKEDGLPLIDKLTAGTVKIDSQPIELLQIDLKKVLEPIADYDPYVVKAGFKQLAAALPKE